MDYLAHYDKLIYRAITREKPEVYTEQHRVLPYGLGDRDDKAAYITLTPEERFVATKLLVKIYPDDITTYYDAVLMGAKFRNNKQYGELKRTLYNLEKKSKRAGKE